MRLAIVMKLFNIKNAMQQVLLTLLLIASAQFTSASEHVTYYVNDALGSPIMALDEAGAVVWQESYQPYGQRQIKPAAANYDEQFYTGKQEESDIGVQYYGARWYDPESGRFTSIDPVGVDESNIHSFNRYAYANNNPYKFVDPDGKYSVGVGGYVTPNENRETLNQAEVVIARGEKVALAMSLGAFGVEGAVAIILGKAFSKFSGQAVAKGGSAEQILQAERISSGLKDDAAHRAASFLSKEQLQAGKTFPLRGGDGVDRTLLQTEGGLNGNKGIYEYILDPAGKVSHQRFIDGGVINGIPNQIVSKAP